jgi:hypothetical protein
MQHKTLALLFVFVVFFSLHGFCQTTEKSTHPLMDKYYPPKKKPEPNIIVPSQPKADPETRAAIETKPVQLRADTATVITPVINTDQSETKVMPVETPTDSIVVNKPVETIAEPVEKKTETKSGSTPYRPTRLGSSSRLYKTWETNNNGAGSVTTGSKN